MTLNCVIVLYSINQISKTVFGKTLVNHPNISYRNIYIVNHYFQRFT